ncbi:MAG: serine protease [Myxococcota bacterium]
MAAAFGTVMFGTVMFGTVMFGTVTFGTVMFGTVTLSVMAFGATADAQVPEAVVMLRCDGVRAGTAFAVSRERLLTAAHAAQCSRDLEAQTADGRRLRLRVAHFDDEHDLAILRSEDELSLVPLSLREGRVTAGEPVRALGFPVDETGAQITPMVTAGAISRSREDALFSDVAVGPGSSGGPLLDANDAVVGVVVATRSGLTQAVPIQAASALLAEPEVQSEARSWVRASLGINLGLLAGRGGTMLGPELTLGLSIRDRWSVRAGFGFFVQRREEIAPMPEIRDRSAALLSLSFGHRFRFHLRSADLTLEPFVGAGVFRTTQERSTFRFGLADPGCSVATDACAIAVTRDVETRRSWRVRPTLGLRLGVADALSVGYQVQLDPRRLEDTTHLVTFGVAF